MRFTVQPVDAPNEAEAILRLIEHLNSDELFLFATDYPHWQFDGDDVLPGGLSGDLFDKITHKNALATYTRLEKADRIMEIGA